MYYPTGVSMRDDQIEQLHLVFRGEGFSRKEPTPHLDVLLHTYGGDPIAAYRLAQVIRDFSSSVNFLVPRHAYSGGTLMCLAGNEIELADYAVLSPIDVTMHVHQEDDGEEEESETFPDEQPGESEIELVAIDHFIQVAKQARIEIESGFRQKKWRSSKTDVESALLCEMTRQLGVLQIARLYREKNITRVYAEELLLRCMFDGIPIGKKRMERILRRLIVDAPAHEFPMDFHMCRDIGLLVSEMDDDLSDQTRAFVKVMDRLSAKRIICPPDEEYGRLPFFQLFPCKIDTSITLGEPIAVAAGEENTNGTRNEQSEGEG